MEKKGEKAKKRKRDTIGGKMLPGVDAPCSKNTAKAKAEPTCECQPASRIVPDENWTDVTVRKL